MNPIRFRTQEKIFSFLKLIRQKAKMRTWDVVNTVKPGNQK